MKAGMQMATPQMTIPMENQPRRSPAGTGLAP
jgi:hypothetical protein